MDILIIMALVFVGGAIYLLPAIVATKRHHHQAWPIYFLNLLLGWTALGWIAALVWASTAVKPELSEGLTKACPACAETIMKAAKVCRYCRKELVAG